MTTTNQNTNTIELLDRWQQELTEVKDQHDQDLHDLLVVLIQGMDALNMSNTKYRFLVDLILNRGWTVENALARIELDDRNESWHYYYWNDDVPKGH